MALNERSEVVAAPLEGLEEDRKGLRLPPPNVSTSGGGRYWGRGGYHIGGGYYRGYLMGVWNIGGFPSCRTPLASILFPLVLTLLHSFPGDVCKGKILHP